MFQISNHIYCDPMIASLKLDPGVLTSPYSDYPFMIIKRFLNDSACERIRRAVHASKEGENAKLRSMRMQSVVDPSEDPSIRKTGIYALEEPFLALYEERFRHHQSAIESFFGIALTTATTVQVLEYLPGSFYVRHADDSSELVNDRGETVGFVPVSPQRKLTSVLFATSHADPAHAPHSYSGGELKFNYLYDANGEGIVVRPEAGDMVLFPSNPLFSHEVMPVREGYRLTLVQWHNALLH